MPSDSPLPAEETLRLVAEPGVTLIDEPVRIRCMQAQPGSDVTLSACTTDGALQDWRSTATFRVGSDGTVDTERDAPHSGTYTEADADGLLWSMQPVEAKGPAFFARRTTRPLDVTVSAELAGDEVAQVRVTKTFAAPGVTRRPCPDAEDITGSLFTAEGKPRPGVLVVPGSDGGQCDHAAGLLASRGFSVLSLAYFGVEDRPPTLRDVDLEYFERAYRWMSARPEVRNGPIAVVGLSRGGELALQLGSMFDWVGAVVAGSPSGIRQAGLTSNYTDYSQPAWTWRGEPLPFLRGKYRATDFFKFFGTWALRRPMKQRNNFERLLKDTDAVEAATIEVERIHGPILLVTGTEDQLWPSGTFARKVMDRLESVGHEFAHEHLSYEGAGHFVCFPYGIPSLPPLTRLSPVSRIVIDFGGTPKANADAARDSWKQVLSFLHAFAQEKSPPLAANREK